MSEDISCKRCQQSYPKGGKRQGAAIRCPRCGYTSRVPGASPPEAHLALRRDLTVEPVDENGSPYYILKDPVENRYFRVKPLEHFLISQFDGRTPLETIRRRASEEKRVLVSDDVLRRFAEKFRELGLLVDPDAPPPGKRRSPGGWTSVFSIRVPLANPEGLLDWLYPKVRFVFGAPFVAAASVSVLAACVVALSNREELRFGLANAVSLEGLLFVLLTVACVSVLHELAHGLTCRHFGGRVTDMGFLLLYLLPCFYCNVSDTYLFPRKRERVWVFFAGGFFELVIWANAVLAWRIVSPETFASRVLFVVAAVCGIRSLFNFNPLIKMDGYFMLSDWLGIHNLRKEALAGVGRMIKRLAGLGVPQLPDELTERRILALPGDRFLALFGVTALAYTAILVGAIVTYSGAYVYDTFGPNALAAFSIGLVGLLHKPAFTAANAAKEAGREKWEKLGQQKKPRFLLVWGAVGLVAVFFPWPLRIASGLRVLPQQREIVRAPAEGRVAQIHVAEGQSVERGDLILEYDAKELELERLTKEAELVQAREELRLLAKQNPTFREEIRVKERALETTRAEEEAAAREFDRARDLWTNALISQDAFDRAKDALERAQARRREAEAQRELARKSSPDSRNEQMEVYHLRDPGAQKAVIEKLEAELARLDDLLRRTKIYASIAGTLTTYRFEEKVGDFLEEGAEVCEIANDERVVVEMPVSEKDIDVVQHGQAVKFKVRGYPTESFRATVDEIAPVATPDEGSSKILIRATVDNRDRLLKPGMTGVAKIYTGMSFMGHILTRDIIRFIRTEFWL